jgi:sensor histidine kinase regulating citrate/malate metabolism
MSDNSSPVTASLDYRAVIDSMGEGILIFDSNDKLVLDNAAARSILGANLPVIRSEGWKAIALLIDTNRTEGPTADEIREQALNQAEAVRFKMLLSGAHIPCWASSVYSGNKGVFTMITITRPDWSALTEVMEKFRAEAQSAITSTKGHADFIIQITKKLQRKITVDQLAERVVGFAELMSVQMARMETLMAQMQRFEDIRTGKLEDKIKRNMKKINLADFLEDFQEDISDKMLYDLDRKDEDYRARLQLDVPDNLSIHAAPRYLNFVLRDVFKNAVMYSPPGSPVTFRAFSTSQGQSVQIDIVDEGYGVREKEMDRVFKPFLRARQPQVIAEFGYGISLYLAKADIEAMGGRIWFSSEEGVSTTFSIKLPVYQAQTQSDSD